MWFPFAAHLVAGLYGTARSIEATARQRSGLVTLGTLAAGLAHEINNPAAAAARSSAELERACDGLLDALRQMASSGVTATQFGELDALRRELAPPTTLPDPLETADREEELGEWLDRSGVARPWELAASLVSAGADIDWVERAAAVSPGDGLGAARLGRAHHRRLLAARRGARVDPPRLRARRRDQVLLPDGPGLAPAGRRP